MTFLDQLIQKAQLTPKRIVLCEGEDLRVLAAGVRAQQDKVAHIHIVGNTKHIQQVAEENKLSLQGITLHDPLNSALRAELIQHYMARRAHKRIDQTLAEQAVNDPLQFAQLLVDLNYADGSVSGAVYSTADVVRSALQLIGKSEQVPIVSSFFLMLLDKAHHPCHQAVIFSDCGLVINPNADELAAIAIAAVKSAKQLLDTEPRIAMLSFSTAGSAKHPAVDKVIEAAHKVKAALPHIAIDEDIQFDAAIIPAIAARKLKNSQVNGQATIFIFPNLEAGNIGYKIAERLGGATAIGPLMQGLAKPANDLSRGCSTDDIYYVIAVTCLQAQHIHP